MVDIVHGYPVIYMNMKKKKKGKREEQKMLSVHHEDARKIQKINKQGQTPTN